MKKIILSSLLISSVTMATGMGLQATINPVKNNVFGYLLNFELDVPYSKVEFKQGISSDKNILYGLYLSKEVLSSEKGSLEPFLGYAVSGQRSDLNKGFSYGIRANVLKTDNGRVFLEALKAKDLIFSIGYKF